MGNILIIDDDIEICETMQSLVSRQNHTCEAAHSIFDGGQAIKTNQFDVVFLDVSLPDGNGLDMLAELSEIPDTPEIIILTGKGDPDGAELAIKQGVWDYLLKPSSVREINLTLSRALRYREEKIGNRKPQEVSTETIIGNSPAIKIACDKVSQAAPSDSNLLVTGDTGTGKEIFSKAIHDNSNRKNGSFVIVDCASLTESLVESILFGHRKGAFTGAHEHQVGLVKLADQGTLFLDEIGEMPLLMQKSFLRVLQEKTFRSVGDSKEQSSDFRLIAATNRNLDEMAENGTFRKDLLYRIKTMMIHLPPLKERNGDIKLLTTYKVQQLCEKIGINDKTISSSVFELLEQYSWPGNVRELFNIIERAVITAGDEKQLFSAHFPSSLRIQVAREQIKQHPELAVDDEKEIQEVRKIGQDILHEIYADGLPSLKEFKAASERIYLLELLQRNDGDLKQILKTSGLSRSHLYSLLKKHKLTIQPE